MCGIAGIYRLDDAPADVAALGPMLEVTAHRGPDDHGTWSRRAVALGHVRLSILDLTERAHQPMVTPDGHGVLVYNGEVYNFALLRAELEARGVRFSSTGDTEVVLRALEHWGPREAIPRFDGMFALAYLDTRSDTLWLARDRMGIKGLYAARTGGAWVFGSEVKAVLAHADVARRPSLRSVDIVLASWTLEDPRTMWESVESVPAGSVWRITRDGVERSRYFQLPDSVDVDRIRAGEDISPDDVVDDFEAALERCVRTHLVSDAPVATLCSGGVDSSLVTAYATDSEPNLVSYVADIEGPEAEGEQGRRVGRHLGVDMRTVDVDAKAHVRRLPRAVWLLDQPTMFASDPALLMVAETCRRDGIRVLVSGEGADELFGGYPWQRKTYEMWKRRQGLRWRLAHSKRRRRQELSRLALSPLATNLGRTDPGIRLRLIGALNASTELRGRRLMDYFAAIEKREDRAFKAQCLDDIPRHLRTILQRHDRMSMGASIETRVPFLANEVIDMGLHAPRSWLYRDGKTKWLVKQAAVRRLPRDVVHARKKGFPAPPTLAAPGRPLLRDGALCELLGWTGQDVDDLLALGPQADPIAFRWVALELWARLTLRGENPDELGERLAASVK